MAIYLEKLRECYEAYVILCFMYYLIALLGGDEKQIINRLNAKVNEQNRHNSSYSCWNYCIPSSLLVLPCSTFTSQDLLHKCKFGVFQYVFVKNMAALFVCILQIFGKYHEGQFRWNESYIYQCFITNISQMYALYCLLHFYNVTKDDLSQWRPIGKFLCVKMVVFFTWWQSIAIELFLATPQSKHFIVTTEHWTVSDISKGLQAYLICIEMFFAAIAFSYAFSHRDYSSHRRENNEQSEPFLSAFLQSSMPDDFVADFRRLTKANSIRKSSSTDLTEKVENANVENTTKGDLELTPLIKEDYDEDDYT